MGWINSKELREKLINIYVGEKTIVPELLKILKSKYTSSNCNA